jgi:hypothetical protein
VKTFSLAEVKERCSLFERQLLQMIPNIQFVKFFGDPIEDSDENNGNNPSYVVRKDKVVMTSYLPRVSHEIAHMVEMKSYGRLLLDDWGFDRITSGTDPKNTFAKANSAFRGMARECRVKAIESFLHKPGYSNNRIIADGWYQIMHRHVGFGRFQSASHIDDWMRHLFEFTQKQWSLDRIQYEWKLRVEFIRNWQETKEI